MTFRLALVWALASSGCGAIQAVPPRVSDSIWVPPLKDSVFVRSIFDDDPSENLGRFLKPGARPDETEAFPSRCRAAFSPRLVGAGGEFDESFVASTGFSGGLSVAPYGKLSGNYGSNGEVRVHYALKKVLRATADADKLAQCCAAASGECSERYISEFYLGDGEIYQFMGDEEGVSSATRSGPPRATIRGQRRSEARAVTRPRVRA